MAPGADGGLPPGRLASLRAAAAGAAPGHHAPYSGKRVLAAVEARDGRVFGGTNIENIALTPTIHAEQSAVVAAMHAGVMELGRDWLTVVYATSTPCGLCRQFLAEFAAPDAIAVIDREAAGECVVLPFWSLLPLGFRPETPSGG